MSKYYTERIIDRIKEESKNSSPELRAGLGKALEIARDEHRKKLESVNEFFEKKERERKERLREEEDLEGIDAL